MKRSLTHCMLAVAAGAAIAFTPTARGEKVTQNEVVAVFAKSFHGYTRTHLADGSFKPETYAFASAGRFDGNVDDPSIDHLTFLQVAGVVANSLKNHGYVGAPRGKDADLLIFLSFGTTMGTDAEDYNHFRYNAQDVQRFAFEKTMRGSQPSPAGRDFGTGVDPLEASHLDDLANAYTLNEMENNQRDKANELNARMLGYSIELEDATYMRPFTTRGQDIVSEVEESRYFVVLKAYDYRELARNHQKKLLWETRFSIARHHNRFDEQLPNMAKFASQFCGENDGLIRRHLPEVRVDVGTPRVVETNATLPAK